MDEFQELKDLVFQNLRGIWKHRWIAVIVAWPLMLGGVAAVDLLEDEYVAETKVYLDSSTILRPLLEGLAIETDFNAIVQLMIKKLLSRPNLERAIRTMNMDVNVRSPREIEFLIQEVRDRIDISADQRTGTYRIFYTDTDRDRAKRMVQTLLNIFIEDTLGKSVIESDSAIDFLNKQITKYDTLLQDAEERLEKFKRENVGLMPRDGANYFSQLQAVKTELEKITTQLNESIGRRDQLMSKLAELSEVKAVKKDTTKTIYDQKIIEAQSRLGDLLLLYTDQHPDVINARMILETLEQRREAERKKARSDPSVVLTENPVYQQVQILLAKTEADISSLQARKVDFEKKNRELSKLIEIVPKIEAELQRLNRDYEVHRQNYTALVKRRETAKISEDVDSGTDQVKFRIIEPPYVPTKPSYPNRKLLDVAVMILALGCGYGLSLLVSFLKPVFYTPSELHKLTNFAVLGAVRKFDTAPVVRARYLNLTLFAIVNLTIIGSGATFAYLHNRDVAILEAVASWWA